MARKMYRARGVYEGTSRDSWLTTVWRRSKEEASSDIVAFGRRHKGTRVVEEDVDAFIKKTQRVPKY